MGANQRTLVDTQIAIPPEYWNRKLLKVYEDLPSEHGDAAELNERLQKMMRLAEDMLSFCIKNTRDNPMFFLKKNFSPDLDITTLEQRKEKTGSLDREIQRPNTQNIKCGL